MLCKILQSFEGGGGLVNGERIKNQRARVKINTEKNGVNVSFLCCKKRRFYVRLGKMDLRRLQGRQKDRNA